MLKFIFKSTLYYVLIKKYKSKIISIIFYLLLMAITTLLYGDIVEFMSLNELKQEVLYLMLSKWLIYTISSYKIFSNIKLILTGDSEDDKLYQKQIIKDEEYIDNVIAKKLDEMYKDIKDKPALKTRKEAIYDKNRSIKER